MNFAEIVALEEQFQVETYSKLPIGIAHGNGCWVEDSAGVRYLDLYGGHAVAATGHCHPHVVKAIQQQAKQLVFYSNIVYSELRASTAQKLVACAPAPMTKAFFCNSGTEANENAMRMARLVTGRENIVSLTEGFHGRTADSISASHLGHYRELGRPNVPGHLFAEFGSIDDVARVTDRSVAGIILEPIQSMAGVRMAAPKFYRALREFCDAHKILLIYDEVQTGVGRTGSWFFSGSKAGGEIVPDIITLAKSLASGVPVGACLTTDRVATQLKTNALGTTFGGGMLAMAAVTATLEAIENDHLMENAITINHYLRDSLSANPVVLSIRGMGALIGIEFQPSMLTAPQIQKELISRRIITGTSSDPRTLRLLPPLCLSTTEIDCFVTALGEITEQRIMNHVQ